MIAKDDDAECTTRECVSEKKLVYSNYWFVLRLKGFTTDLNRPFSSRNISQHNLFEKDEIILSYLNYKTNIVYIRWKRRM